MKKDQRERIVKRHHHSIWMHGHSPQALYWESREAQTLRFDVLLDCGVKSGESVLDVGCGFADLFHYMKEKNIEVDYTGIDLSPDMIQAANKKVAGLSLIEGDLFDVNPSVKSYDWVLLSGAMNEPLEDGGAYMKKMIRHMYSACRKGVAFNLLNSQYEWLARDLYTLQPYAPEDVMSELGLLSPCTKLRTDYLDVDASYFIWRDKQFRPL